MKSTVKDRWFEGIIIAILLFMVVLMLYPFYYSFLYSINSITNSQASISRYFIPQYFSLENYEAVFKEKTIYTAFLVTAARTLVGTLVSVFFTAMVAHPLSKKYLKFRRIYLRIGIITMYFGGGLIPVYILFSKLGLIDNFLVYIIPGMLSFFNCVLFISFFKEIPDALEESAKIDGAHDFYIFIRIIIPLSSPVLATIALFNGVGHWNSWFDSAFFTNSPYLQTLQAVLWKIISQAEAVEIIKRNTRMKVQSLSTIESIKFATMIVSIIPITLAYPFLQKYFIKGMMIGSLKG